MLSCIALGVWSIRRSYDIDRSPPRGDSCVGTFSLGEAMKLLNDSLIFGLARYITGGESV